MTKAIDKNQWKVWGARIPPDLLKRIVDICNSDGLKKEFIQIKAIELFLADYEN